MRHVAAPQIARTWRLISSALECMVLEDIVNVVVISVLGNAWRGPSRGIKEDVGDDQKK